MFESDNLRKFNKFVVNHNFCICYNVMLFIFCAQVLVFWGLGMRSIALFVAHYLTFNIVRILYVFEVKKTYFAKNKSFFTILLSDYGFVLVNLLLIITTFFRNTEYVLTILIYIILGTTILIYANNKLKK